MKFYYYYNKDEDADEKRREVNAWRRDFRRQSDNIIQVLRRFYEHLYMEVLWTLFYYYYY